jgi:DNA primase
MSQRISQNFVQELIARSDIVELIQRRLTLKKMGANYGACCPFHNEKTPSFTVSSTKQFYHCFGCGAHGNAIGFLMAYDRLQFVEAVEELAQQLGVAIPQEFSTSAPKPQLPLYALLEKIAQYYQVQLEAAPKALAYLKMRGVSTEIMQRFAMGFAPASWDQVLRQFGVANEAKAQLLQTGMLIKNDQGKLYDRFRDRLMVPIRDHRGRVIAFGGRTLGDDTPKYLNSPETPLFYKGSELFGLYEALDARATLDFCLIVEGYMDVIALHQFGLTQAVGTMGTATSEKHLQRLFRYTKNLIFCFDGDNAGQTAAWRALENSLPVQNDGVQIHFMFLPQQHDPDSLLHQEGIAAFKQRMKEAVPLSDFFFKKLTAALDMNTPAGKAKLVQLCKEPLLKMPTGVFRDLMLQTLAEKVGMSLPAIEKHLLQESAAPTSSFNEVQQSKLLLPVQIAIALLLQHPILAQRITMPVELQHINLPGVSTLRALFSQLQETPGLSTGAILEYWRGAKAAEQLAKLAVCKLITPTDGMEAELLGALYKIIAQNREAQIQLLQAKVVQQVISQPEKELLLRLLAERH